MIHTTLKDSSLREVSKEEGMKLSEKYGFMFEETSAFTSKNVIRVFQMLLECKLILILRLFTRNKLKIW